jgi:hypothetical protein
MMPVSKAVAEGKVPANAKKKKSLKVFEVVREGRIFWQTDAKLPPTMVTNLGWAEAADGLFEIERPKTCNLPDFGRSIEGYGFNLKRLEQRKVVAAAVPKDEALEEGKAVLDTYLQAKEAEKRAKEDAQEARGGLQDWLQDNGAPKDPAHPEARVAQIGTHKVHNSYVRGRETKWDDRDPDPVADWAEQDGHAEELVSVILHKTIPYEEYAKSGIPEGFEGTFNIDPDVYDYYVRIGAVPPDVHDSFENRGSGYYGVKVYETKEYACPNCDHKVGKTQKFCGECGTKVKDE